MTGQRIQQRICAWLLGPARESDQRHHDARRAEATLQRMLIAHGLLHWMQRSVRICEAFHRADAGAVGLHCQKQTRAHRLAIQHDRARATHAVLAAQMHAGIACLRA